MISRAEKERAAGSTGASRASARAESRSARADQLVPQGACADGAENFGVGVGAEAQSDEARAQSFEQAHKARVSCTEPAFKVFFQGSGKGGASAARGQGQHERAVLHMGGHDEASPGVLFQRAGHVAEHAGGAAQAGYGGVDLGGRRGREDEGDAFDVFGAEAAGLAGERGAVHILKGIAEGGFVHARVEHEQGGGAAFEQGGGFAAAYAPGSHQQTAGFGEVEEEGIVAHG